MASSYNVVLLVDTAEPAVKDQVRLVSLRLLNFLTCRAGLGHVRWSYRFLNSQGGRCRAPRRSDLRELGPRSLDEFEEELEVAWDRARNSRACNPPSSRAQLTHGALMETLTDFQWDRPDISSPTKPALLRARRGGRVIARDETLQAESPSENVAHWSCKNAVFLLSPCPHSGTQLTEFTASSGETSLQQVMDKLLSRGLHNVITKKRVTLYWMDTLDWSQVWNSYEHSGYWTMVELMQHVGGRMLPSVSLLPSRQQLSFSPLSLATSLEIPFDSVLNYIICNEADNRLWFPQQDGVVLFMESGSDGHWKCPITLEPVTVNQNHLKNLVTLQLTGTVQHWNQNPSCLLTMDTWIIQIPTKEEPSGPFQKLLRSLRSRGLQMVADIYTQEDLCPNTGILTPVSESVSILNVMCSEKTDAFEGLYLHGTFNDTCEEISSDLPDIISSVINNVCTSEENTFSALQVPEWINQELAQSGHWDTTVIEKWYPLSGSSGASSNLMESFRLINAACFEEDDQLKCDQEITHCLSEYYQKKSSEDSGTAVQGENPRKRLPRTPVRQKMKTMPRALQMLNTARLNVKAQKTQPDSTLLAPSEKNPQVKRRSDKQEEKGKPFKFADFTSEEELFSILNEDYEKALSCHEDSLLTCARNSITVIKSYLRSNTTDHSEIGCVDKIRPLLKTSKSIRQLYGNCQKKETKLRECQIQVFLRLEMCVQCPVTQTSTDELEQIIEETTDMLRIISLTEDPSYLTKFLNEDILTEYLTTIPKILSEMYFGLGIQIPEDLALVLPEDDDDESVGTTPAYPQQSISRVPSVVQIATETEQLEELRTRSAKKRRTSTIARHRSIAESSQSMRQIEIPKKQLNKENMKSNLVVLVEKLKLPLSGQVQKEGETTKARRNLFDQNMLSPTRRSSKMPRSQSVCTVEDLKHKRSKSHDGTKDLHKLLTKKVSETPVHKQRSNRLLYRQIKGRHSESTSSISIVEESPEKDIREIDLRRSPRIKQLTLNRRNSSSFYASQSNSRNLERVLSSTQPQPCAARAGNTTILEVRTPKRLLFGEVLKINSPPVTRYATRNLNEAEPVTCQTPGKTKKKTPSEAFEELLLESKKPRKSPRTPRTPTQMPKRLKTPSKSSTERKTSAKNLGKLFSPSKLNKLKLCEKAENLTQTTPAKESSSKFFVSPVKNVKDRTAFQIEERLQGPLSKIALRTPTRNSNSHNNTLWLQAEVTPSKSHHSLQESVEQCSTSPRYVFRTPQKTASVSYRPIPNSVETADHVALHCAIECTPEKQKIFSPRKRTTYCFSPNGMPKDICASSVSVKTSGFQNRSVSLSPLTFQTPKKPLSGNAKLIGLPQLIGAHDEPARPDDGHLLTATEENSDVLTNVVGDAQEWTCSKSSGIRQAPPHSPEFIPPKCAKITESNIVLPQLKVNSSSSLGSPNGKGYPIVLCEKLDMSSLGSTENSESLVSSSQTEESIDITDAKVVPAETSELKMKVLITRKSSDCIIKSNLPTTPTCVGNVFCHSPYGLRCTPDRRQREAAARLETLQNPTQFSTPKSHQSVNPLVIPTYEVELEMQASGLPKLRFKRTDSSSTVDMDSPRIAKKRKVDDGERWCTKHPAKVEPACASPSCLRTSHTTPGKCSLQTFICQSYTPNRGATNAESPSQLEVPVPWTPSPKLKEKNGSDVINKWPRRKKASGLHTNVFKEEKNLDYIDLPPVEEDVAISEQDVNKVSYLEEFGLEGISKLQEKSPVLKWQGTSDAGSLRLNSRKRGLDLVSPTKETEHYIKRACTNREISLVTDGTEISSSSQSLSSHVISSPQSSCEDEVFNISGVTPPNKALKHSLSVSGLLSLTQSPMLYQGKTPLSKREMQDDEANQGTPKLKRQAFQTSDSDDSPLRQATPVRPIHRTYTRKKLIP
ncbi:treslin [Pelodytes ibericus]